MSGLRTVAEQNEATAAVGKMLAAMEGMQEQLAALTDIVVRQDKELQAFGKRLAKLEFGPAPVVDIRGRLKGKA